MAMFLLELSRTAEKGAESLNARSTEKLRRFLRSLERADGGFAGSSTAETGDLYYTPFALMALSALGTPAAPSGPAKFAASIRGLGSLDLAHLASLARLKALVAISSSSKTSDSTRTEKESTRERLTAEIMRFRSRDGGFSHFARSAECSTPYGVFLALNALAELDAVPRDAAKIAAPLLEHQRSDGSFANTPVEKEGALNATTAAAAILAEFGASLDFDVESTVNFIRSMEFPSGGFKAVAIAPLPDVLSTASALFVLRLSGIELNGSERKRHSEFIRDHWRETSATSAGFAGDITSDTPDSEYTFHALLALGVLA
jgi:prenyltransferase beta subunit